MLQVSIQQQANELFKVAKLKKKLTKASKKVGRILKIMEEDWYKNVKIYVLCVYVLNFAGVEVSQD
jgi:maltodextrin utilization protein YvdJ